MDWTIQVHKRRSLRDKLTGRNKLADDDPLSSLIERLVRQDDGMTGIEIARETD